MSDNTQRVWDPLIRLFHWTLVVAFSIAYFTGEEENLLHAWSGYVVAGLVLFRVFWGFVGSRHARFRDFVSPPSRVAGYLRSLARGEPAHYTGHNPAGGWMVLALLASLLVTSYSGVVVYGLEGYGPLAGGVPEISVVSTAHADSDSTGQDSAGMEEFWEELHELFANVTLLLVFIHVTGVIVASRLHGENLVKAMITGRKRVID